MFSDLSKEHSDAFATEQTSSPDTQQLEISPSAIQLQNIFPVEITTKRFPVDKTVDMASAHIQLNWVRWELTLRHYRHRYSWRYM